MAENKVKRENYITIQGFMLTDLKLKGNELLIYACIYGFSQAENQVFNGSLQYLADWTNSTKQGVIKCLKSLEEKQFIVKKENFINGVKFCEYYTTKFNTPLNNVDRGIQQSLIPPVKQSLPNNISNNNINNNIYKEKENILKEKEKYLSLFSLWNEQNISVHRDSTSEEFVKAYEKASKKYTYEQIKTAIERYGIIYHSNYFFNYKWSFDEFLSQKNCIPTLLDNGSKWINYNEWLENSGKGNKPIVDGSGYKVL